MGGGQESAEFYWLGKKKRRILTEEFLPENRQEARLVSRRERSSKDLRDEVGGCVLGDLGGSDPWGVRGAGLATGVLAAQQSSSALPEERNLLQRSFEQRSKYHEFSRLPESK